jgi:uncharacterized protein YxjI
MRYVMKQKVFSWADDYVIKNENDDDAFLVDGKSFSLGSQLSFQDLKGFSSAVLSSTWNVG